MSLAPARDACAYVLTDLVVRDQTIERIVTTDFAYRTRRVDRLLVEGDSIARTARWQFPQRSVEASYNAKGRELTVFQSGNELARLITTGEEQGFGFVSSTEFASGGGGFVALRGAAGVGTAMNIFREFHSGPGVEGHIVLERRPDGSFKQETGSGVTGPGGGITTSRSWTNLDLASGKWINTQQNTVTHPGGATTVTTTNTTQDVTDDFGDKPDPGHHKVTTTTGTAETRGDGGFSTFTETHGSRGSSESQRSAYTNDGKGNESESTVTYHDDGSFTIETRSKDENGNRSESAKTYDESGEPVEPHDDQPTPDDDPGGGELPADDGYDPNPRPNARGSGEGELPADDGSDPCPRPNMAGPGAAVFERWVSTLGPFLGGQGRTSGVHPGDPINRVLGAIADEEDGVGGRSEDGLQLGFDLRAVILRERDPENNPKALLDALTEHAAIAANSPGAIAASRAIRQLEG